MIEKIGIFIVFLCPLIFFHELGHYLFARLFGVRVEVFSLGFGPKLIKFKRGFTKYAISLIPLGGYIKMFGDDPLEKDSVPDEDRKYTFCHKSKWARFWIVFAGPLANFVLAYVIFFSLFMAGERLPKIKFGVIPETSTFHEVGIRTGDVLKKINGKEVLSPTDFDIGGNKKVQTITVSRDNQDRQISCDFEAKKFFDQFFKYPPILRKPIVVGTLGEKYAVSLNASGVNWQQSLDQIVSSKTGSSVDLILFKMIEDKVDGIFKTISFSYNSRKDFFEKLYNEGFYPLDLIAKSIKMGSASDEGGLKATDAIISIDGSLITSFENLRSLLQKTKGETVSIKVSRKGEVLEFSLKPKIAKQDKKEVKLIGVYSSGEYIDVEYVDTKSKGFFPSLKLAFFRFTDSVYKTMNGFIKLFTGAVSLKNVGGPIAIGKVASDSFHTSLSYFFQIMALISVNLGLINLFPIPVLDGGHIMFLFVEMINRKSISRRKLEIAQQLGLSILLLLMFAALFNDFSRLF